MNAKLYAYNRAATVTEDTLRELFHGAGAVVAGELIPERVIGQPRASTLVTMSTPAEATKAIELFNAYMLAEQPLTVNIAKPRAARPALRIPGGPRASGHPRR